MNRCQARLDTFTTHRQCKNKTRVNTVTITGGIIDVVKKLSRKTIIRKLDTLVREICLKKYPKCVICGSDKNLQCGHLFSRVAYSTRWHLPNLATQCAGCNLRHEYDSGPFTLWYIKNYSLKEYDELHFLFSSPRPIKTWELEELYQRLSEGVE